MTVVTVALFFEAVLVLVSCAVVFGLLARSLAADPGQPAFWSKSMAIDYAYALLGAGYAALVPAGVWLASLAVFPHGTAQTGSTRLAGLPLAVQLLLLVAGTDFIQYWLHRAFHGHHLWRFHAIHHGATEIHWTTAFRVHPVNYLISNTLLLVAARLLGFAPLAFLLASPIFFFSTALIHANVEWSFGPLRYIFVSPLFHRWHHALADKTRDANFGTLLACWDLVFGTFALPEGIPAAYGAEGVPEGLVQQMLYPFNGFVAGRDVATDGQPIASAAFMGGRPRR